MTDDTEYMSNDFMTRHRTATLKAWGMFVLNSLLGLYAAFYGPKVLVAILFVSIAFQALAHERHAYWTQVKAEFEAENTL